MKIANHLFLGSLALSASMIGCNNKSNEMPREKPVELESHSQSEIDSVDEKS